MVPPRTMSTLGPSTKAMSDPPSRMDPMTRPNPSTIPTTVAISRRVIGPGAPRLRRRPDGWRAAACSCVEWRAWPACCCSPSSWPSPAAGRRCHCLRPTRRRRPLPPAPAGPPTPTASAGCVTRPYLAAVVQAYRVATTHVGPGARPPDRPLGRDSRRRRDGDQQPRVRVERARLGLGYSPESWNLWVRRRGPTPARRRRFLARVRDSAAASPSSPTDCSRSARTPPRCSVGSPSPTTPCCAAPTVGRPTRTRASRPWRVASRRPAPIRWRSSPSRDNIQDFRTSQAVRQRADGVAEFGVRFFVMPNPMYGSWQ